MLLILLVVLLALALAGGDQGYGRYRGASLSPVAVVPPILLLTGTLNL